MNISQLIYIDNLSLVVTVLMSFVVFCVALFSVNYLHGDRKQFAFYTHLILMMLSVFVMVCADHLLLLLGAWALSNSMLVRLMLHKKEWKAAKFSSILAFANFSLGFLFLGGAFFVMYKLTGETSIQKILHTPIEPLFLTICGLLILLSAMSQSAIWPFHKWLISSLNSPAPVSAVMHAGLVNGGGFLLTRFAPMLIKQPGMLKVIFIVGMVTAILGTLWKLMQTDVKRMLACSTMGQMGFMFVQCGLGLFSAAISHLCWHGLFKANLFLGSAGLAHEKRLDLDYPPTLRLFGLALLCGVAGAFVFAHMINATFSFKNTTFFLIVLVMIFGAQFALSVLKSTSRMRLLYAFLMTGAMGVFYGFSFGLMEQILKPLGVSQSQPISALHIIALIILAIAWLANLFFINGKKMVLPSWMLRLYVQMLNAGQPHPKTVTAYRNHYQY